MCFQGSSLGKIRYSGPAPAFSDSQAMRALTNRSTIQPSLSYGPFLFVFYPAGLLVLINTLVSILT
jgi:hypothetical protein